MILQATRAVLDGANVINIMVPLTVAVVPDERIRQWDADRWAFGPEPFRALY